MDDFLSIAVSNAVAATVLALLAIAVSAVYRRPALAHGLWLLVLLKLVTPPLVFLPIAWPAAPDAPLPEPASVLEELVDSTPPAVEERPALVAVPQAREQDAAEASAPPIVEESRVMLAAAGLSMGPQVLRVVWAVGALAWFVLALERLDHFRRLLRFSRTAPAALQDRTRRLAQSLGLRLCPRVRLLPGRIAPMLWAFGGPPRLLMPAELLHVLSDDQLDTLLLHELAHLRRRDHWVRILEFVVMGLYWWHPIVWFARRELHEAEEQCCDAWVVSTLPGVGRTYASALVDTLDFLSTAQVAVPPLASGLGRIADLKRRLTMIMRGNTPRSLTWPGSLAVVALALTFLPMLPALHGQTPSKEESGKFVVDDNLVADEGVAERDAAVKKAKAEVDAQKARLERQKAALAAAEVGLKRAMATMEQRMKVQELQTMLSKKKAATARLTQFNTNLDQLKKLQVEESKGKIAIAIVIDADAGVVDVAELQKKLKNLFPQKDAKVHISIAEGGHIKFTAPGIPPRAVPAPPAPPKGVAPPAPPKFPSSREDRRINELEKKLEKVLRELQELRRQMKEPSPHSMLPKVPRNALKPVTLPVDAWNPVPLRVLIAPLDAQKQP